MNGFIGVGIDTEQYVFVAGIIAIFYSVDYRAVAGGEGDKASLLACIYLVPFFIGIYIIYRVVDTFIGGISIGDDEISYGISCREFGGDITVFVLIQKLYFCILLYGSVISGIFVTTSRPSGIRVVSCNGCIGNDNEFVYLVRAVGNFIGLVVIIADGSQVTRTFGQEGQIQFCIGNRYVLSLVVDICLGNGGVHMLCIAHQSSVVQIAGFAVITFPQCVL